MIVWSVSSLWSDREHSFSQHEVKCLIKSKKTTAQRKRRDATFHILKEGMHEAAAMMLSDPVICAQLSVETGCLLSPDVLPNKRFHNLSDTS